MSTLWAEANVGAATRHRTANAVLQAPVLKGIFFIGTARVLTTGEAPAEM
jgi:hypothetical protein